MRPGVSSVIYNRVWVAAQKIAGFCDTQSQINIVTAQFKWKVLIEHSDFEQ